MGTYILILMFVLVAIAVTFATYNLSMIKSMSPEERYKLLYFKDDQVSIGIGLVRRTYKLKDIREVRFSKGKKFRSMGSWAGRMKICKINGKTSRWIEFDGTVYYKKMVYITNEEIIDKSIELLMKEFRSRGIQCNKYRQYHTKTASRNFEKPFAIGAPSRIRTCAPGSGDRRSIP